MSLYRAWLPQTRTTAFCVPALPTWVCLVSAEVFFPAMMLSVTSSAWGTFSRLTETALSRVQHKDAVRAPGQHGTSHTYTASVCRPSHEKGSETWQPPCTWSSRLMPTVTFVHILLATSDKLLGFFVILSVLNFCSYMSTLPLAS